MFDYPRVYIAKLAMGGLHLLRRPHQVGHIDPGARLPPSPVETSNGVEHLEHSRTHVIEYINHFNIREFGNSDGRIEISSEFRMEWIEIAGSYLSVSKKTDSQAILYIIPSERRLEQ